MTADFSESMSSMRFLPGAACRWSTVPSMVDLIWVRSSASLALLILVESSWRLASMLIFWASSWIFLASSLGISACACASRAAWLSVVNLALFTSRSETIPLSSLTRRSELSRAWFSCAFMELILLSAAMISESMMLYSVQCASIIF